MSIRHGLLALLNSDPKYGYQLRAEFEATTGGSWPLNIGQVYTTLSRLDRDGAVRAAGDPDDTGRVVYEITTVGRAELAEWFSSPVEHDARPRDELVIKLAMAVTTPGVDALAVIDAQRAAAQRAIRTATRRKAGADPPDLAARLIAEAGIYAAEAEIRWLDHCEATLRATPRTKTTEPTDNGRVTR
ncbi:MAG TPA: PadR family transcriptional regulator [Sporichthyaceae bacterium]|jgi:DNA-binding PadR family transcriptional regulator